MKDILQLPDLDNGRYRCKFKTAQAKDDLKVPWGEQNDPTKPFEPLTRDYLNNGDGGGAQLLLEHKEVVIEEVFDTVEQRNLTAIEIEDLVNL